MMGAAGVCLDFVHFRARLEGSEDKMLEFLPKEVREGLEAAQKRDRMRKSRLRVQVGEAVCRPGQDVNTAEDLVRAADALAQGSARY